MPPCCGYRAGEVPRAAPKKAAEPRLAGFLAEEIRRGLVAVDDRADRSTVTIVGDGLFKAGEANVRPEDLWLINRIGEELTKVPGKVEVIGYTDNQPIRTLRFPSNWELSKARAESVSRLIAARIPGSPHRLRRAWRGRPGGPERHAAGAGEEPARGDHGLRARGRRRRGRAGRELAPAMRWLLGLLFRRWLLILILLIALALLVWWVGPTVAINNFHPFESETIRWIQIALLFLTPAVKMSWTYFRKRKADAALADGLVKQEAPPDPARGEVAQLRQRFEEALALLRKRRFGTERPSLWTRLGAMGSKQFLYDLPWYVFIGAPGSGKTTALVQLRPALPARRPLRRGGGARRRRHAQLRLVVHRRRGAPRHRRPLHDPGEPEGGRRRRPGRASSTC